MKTIKLYFITLVIIFPNYLFSQSENTFSDYANNFTESYINNVYDFTSQCESKIETFDFDKGKNIKESPQKSYEYLKYFFAFKNYKVSENIIEFTDGEYTIKLYFRQDTRGTWKFYKYDGIA